MSTLVPLCPCLLAPGAHLVEWECPAGHQGRARLCGPHAAAHVVSLVSSGVACGRCRDAGRERAVTLTGLDGKALTPADVRAIAAAL